MPRPSLALLALIVGSATAAAQKPVLRTFERVVGPVKDAGVYHLATGTWTRGPAGAQLAGSASDIVYNCTSPSGYYAYPLGPGQTWTTSGRLPSTTSPESVWNPYAVPLGTRPGSARGCADAYGIDGFQIAYCARGAGATTAMTVAFYASWPTPCTTAVAGPPQGGPFAFTGLPGNGSGTASFTCWTLNVDLAGSSASFSILADGDGSYSANTDDAFAWTFTFPSTTSTTNAAGPLLAGCPADGSGPLHQYYGWTEFPPGITTEAAGYDGTRFDGPVGAAAPRFPANGAVGLPTPGGEDGSDMVADDAVRIEGGSSSPGCYFFGGPMGGSVMQGPYTNFHLELYATVACVDAPGEGFCFGDAFDPSFPTDCPCLNLGDGGHGCASSFNVHGAQLRASGAVAQDDVVLTVTGMNATGTCFFLKGDQELASGYVFGDGVACVTGSLIRLRQQALSAGTASFPDASDTITLSARGGTPVGSGLAANYAVYYRNAASFCTPATFNVSNGWRIVW